MSEFCKTSYTLLHRALDIGDEAAWEQLVAHYRRFICHVLHKLNVAHSDVDDLCQQVLIKLIRDLPSYNRSKSLFRTWLSTVIRHAAIDYFRKQASYRKRINGLRLETNAKSLGQPAEIEAKIEREWGTYIASQAMERVRGVFQGQAIEVFELGLDGLSAAEISVKTGLTVASIYTLRKRVKKRLYLEVLEITENLEP